MDDKQIEFIKQELLRKQNEAWQDYDEYRPPELYHYTTADGFRGIIEGRQLWCTDVTEVNDPREGDHGMSVIRSILARKSVYKKFVEVVSRSSSLFGMKQNWTGYIACFCSAGELPHMWADYASGGSGYALVFDYRSLFAGCNGGKNYTVFRILYDKAMQIRKAEQMVDRAIYLERELSVPRRDRDQFWMEVEFALLSCAVRFKDSNWSREEECRLWVSGGPDTGPFEAFGKHRVKINFDPGCLLRVVRGKAATDLSSDQIRGLLQRHGFAPEVAVAEAAL